MARPVGNNLCITPEVGSEDMDPDVSTRMIILGPKANVSESEVVNFLHLLDLPLTIKWTCYGAMVSGKDEHVRQAIEELRKLDPYGIFTKERGFAPGDPRKCRGHRHGPREGFHQMEKEFQILDYVGEALKHPKDVHVEKKEPVSLDLFKEALEDSFKEEKKQEGK